MEVRSSTSSIGLNPTVGSGAGSEASVQQEEQAPLMQERGVVEGQNMKVMVALDDSDGSFYALKWALTKLFKPKTMAPTLPDDPNLSLHVEGCFLYLVHVQHPFHYYAGPGFHTAPYTSATVVESVKQAQVEMSAKILDRALSICKQNKVRAETLVLEGDPKDEICKAVEQTHVDMLVVGSRGLGQIKRAFLGSVSDYCAHHASCPVLIVKPSKDAVKTK